MKKKNLAILAGLGLTFTLASCGKKPEDVWRGDLDDLSVVNPNINVGSAANNSKQTDGITSYVGEFAYSSASRDITIVDSTNNVLKVKNSTGHIGFYSLAEQKYILEPQFQADFVESATIYSDTVNTAGEILVVRVSGTTYVYDIYGSKLYEGKGTFTKVTGTMVNNKAYVSLYITKDGNAIKRYFEYSEANTPKEVESVPNSTKKEAETVDYKETKFGDTYNTTAKYDLNQFGINGYVLKSSTTYTIFNNDKEIKTIKLPKNSTGYYIGSNLYYQDSELEGDEISVDTYKVDLSTGEVSKVKKFGYKIASATLYKDEKGVENYAVAQLYKVYKDHVSNDAEVYVLDADLTLHDSLNGLVNFYPDTLTKIGDNYYDSTTRIIYDHEFKAISYLSDLTVTINPEYNLLIVYKSVNGITYYGALDFNGKVVIPLEYRSLIPLESASYSYAIDAQEGCIIAKKIDADGNNQFYRVNYKTGEATYLGKDVSCLVDDLYWTTTNTETESSISFMSQAKTLTTVKATHGGVLSISNSNVAGMTLNDAKYYTLTVTETYIDEYNQTQYDYHRLTFAYNKAKTPLTTVGEEVKTEENLGITMRDSIEVKLGDNNFNAHSGTVYLKFTAEEDGVYLFTGYDGLYANSYITDLYEASSMTQLSVDEGSAYYAKLKKGKTIYLYANNGTYKKNVNMNVSKLADGVTKSNIKDLAIGETYTVPKTKSRVTYYEINLPYDYRNSTTPVRVTTNTDKALITFVSNTSYYYTRTLTPKYDKEYDKFYDLDTNSTYYFHVLVDEDYEDDVTISVTPVTADELKKENVASHNPVTAANPIKINTTEATKISHVGGTYECVTYTNETEEVQSVYFSGYTYNDDGDKIPSYVDTCFYYDEDGEQQFVDYNIMNLKPGQTVYGYVSASNSKDIYVIARTPQIVDDKDDTVNVLDKEYTLVKYVNTTDKTIYVNNVSLKYKEEDVDKSVSLDDIVIETKDNKRISTNDKYALEPGDAIYLYADYNNKAIEGTKLSVDYTIIDAIPEGEVTLTNENTKVDDEFIYEFVAPASGYYRPNYEEIESHNTSYSINLYVLYYNRYLISVGIDDLGVYLHKGESIYQKLSIDSVVDENDFSLKFKTGMKAVEATAELDKAYEVDCESRKYYSVSWLKEYTASQNYYVKGTVVAAEKDASNNMTITISDGLQTVKVDKLYSVSEDECYFDYSDIFNYSNNSTVVLDQVETLPEVGSFVYLWGYYSSGKINQATLVNNPKTLPTEAYKYNETKYTSDFDDEFIATGVNIRTSILGIDDGYLSIIAAENDAATIPETSVDGENVNLTLYKSAVEDGKGNSLVAYYTETSSYISTLKLNIKDGSKKPTVIADGKVISEVEGVYTLNTDNFTIINNSDEDVVITGLEYVVKNLSSYKVESDLYDISDAGIVTIDLDLDKDDFTRCDISYSVYLNGQSLTSGVLNSSAKSERITFSAYEAGQLFINYTFATYSSNRAGTYYNNEHDYTFTRNVSFSKMTALEVGKDIETTIDMDKKDHKLMYSYEASENGNLYLELDTKYPHSNNIVVLKYNEEGSSWSEIKNTTDDIVSINAEEGEKFIIYVSVKSTVVDEDVKLKYTLSSKFTPCNVTLDESGKATVKDVNNDWLVYTAGETNEIIHVSTKSTNFKVQLGDDNPTTFTGTDGYFIVPAGANLFVIMQSKGEDYTFEKLTTFSDKITTDKENIVLNSVSITSNYDIYITVDKESLNGKATIFTTTIDKSLVAKTTNSNSYNFEATNFVKNADGTYTFKFTTKLYKNCDYAFDIDLKDATLVSVEVKR